MFGVYFGKYLEDIGVISHETYQDIIDQCRNSKVELGVLAVEEGMMIDAQADEVNFLQTMQDMKFGDIAISMNYITPEQLDVLLKKQGNGYMRFVRILLDNGILSLDEIEKHLEDFRENEKYDVEELEGLKRSDIETVVGAYLKNVDLNDMERSYFRLMARNLVRFVDKHVRFEMCTECDTYTARFLISQALTGDHNLLCGLADIGVAVIAEEYCEEDFFEINEDCLDAACEYLNVTDGTFLSQLSEEGVDMDLQLPQFYTDYVTLHAKKMFVLPCYLYGERADIILCADGKWEID